MSNEPSSFHLPLEAWLHRLVFGCVRARLVNALAASAQAVCVAARRVLAPALGRAVVGGIVLVLTRSRKELRDLEILRALLRVRSLTGRQLNATFFTCPRR